MTTLRAAPRRPGQIGRGAVRPRVAAAGLRAVAVIGVAVAVLGPAGPAAADPAGDLRVTGTKAAPGKVSFLLSSTNLPPGGSLADAQLVVRAGGVEVPATIQPPGVPSVRRGVVVVFDASGSMAGTRLASARSAAASYALSLPADVRVGLVTVADQARSLLTPTTSRPAFTTALSQVQAAGGTALYDGVEQAVAMLRDAGLDSHADRRVLVVSDGEDTKSRTSLGVVAHAVDSGRIGVDVIGLEVTAGGSALRRLTDAGRGRLIAAADSAALGVAFKSVAVSFATQVTVTAKVPPGLAGRTTALQVDATVAGRQLVAAPVSFDAAKEGRPPHSYQVPAPPGGMIAAIAAIAFLALFLLTIGLLRPTLERAQQRKRIGQLEQFGVHNVAPQAGADTGINANPFARTALGWAEAAVQSRGRAERMALELERAGMKLRPNEWTLLRVGISTGLVVLLGALLPWWLGIPAGLLAGWLLTLYYRVSRTSKRARKFAEQLPEAFQLVVGSLQSGFSLPQALSAMIRDSAEPLSSELGRALAETRLGTTLEDALEQVAERVGSQDLSWAVMAIKIQREVGGNLAEVLQTAVSTMRERDSLRRHVRALSAEGRLSAWVLVGMPIVVGVWMFVLRRDYVRPLYTDPIGIGMLVVAVVMIGIGAFWMSRLINVEV